MKLFSLLRHAELRALFGAQVLGGLGDWAGRLAISLLVFDRSGSALWAALVVAVSLLPWLGFGQMLATFADRLGRVRLMVVSLLVRAAVMVAVALLAFEVPLVLLLVLVFLAGLCVPPFVGARSSALVEVSPPDEYRQALVLYGVLSQVEVLVGYAAGGLVIAQLGPELALGVNAALYTTAAVLLGAGLRASPAARPNESAPLGWDGVRSGVAVWRADPVAGRALALFVSVASLMVLPEALVVPFADEMGVAQSLVGVVAASVAVGAVAGMVTAPSGPDHRALLRRAAARGVLLASVSAALFAVGGLSGLAWVAVAGFVVSGAVDAIAVPTNQVAGERLPAQGRAAAMSVAGGVLYGTQVVTVSTAGVVAAVWSPSGTLAVATTGAAVLCVLSLLRPVPATEPVGGD